ncbi:MAG: hypothetical protein EBS89_11360 [Proteobacteria bacterium]|nr:hypothetical protein [Pseudomonadota bacterium]
MAKKRKKRKNQSFIFLTLKVMFFLISVKHSPTMVGYSLNASRNPQVIVFIAKHVKKNLEQMEFQNAELLLKERKWN